MAREQGPVGERVDGPPAVFGGRTAPAARTLMDVLDLTVLDLTVLLHPREPALDDGQTSLSYQELAGAVDALRRRLAAAGIGVGDRVGVRLPSGTNDLYEAGPGNPLAPHSPGQPLR
ncbi:MULTISPECIES: hypothetical protein [unclassified Streptomyces]|uniref:hypothetical protein n=1 Tax=Streptomyces sp. 2112.3 TaxID=1881023 RepID=UPI0015A68CF2